jgi:hypothetical protein
MRMTMRPARMSARSPRRCSTPISRASQLPGVAPMVSIPMLTRSPTASR